MNYRGSCHCGTIAYEVEGIGPDGQAMAAVNARCLEDIDASALPVQHYDGRNA
ncbi:hypothetical protein [Pseudomonas aeruginosa]|nr:hypothetical protein [Pseudomonas aeruginosa]HBN9778695.1 hypothetical protein [Pseudomonas aeruginosa]HBN9848558.1 hypothetical protein [Pseudomonas aeruginosa]HBN9861889.1 hypothetical protein [Pseudomonas aeruginosa]HBN9894009.1 hypothetical protein [Pseudomonas aeruginosa]